MALLLSPRPPRYHYVYFPQVILIKHNVNLTGIMKAGIKLALLELNFEMAVSHSVFFLRKARHSGIGLMPFGGAKGLRSVWRRS